MNKELHKIYTNKLTKARKDITNLKAKNTSFILGEVVSFVASIGFVFLYAMYYPSLWVLLGTALCAIIYFIIRNLDGKNDIKIKKLRALATIFHREINYLDGDFTELDDGNRYRNSHHPYSFDLDIFGPQSLFQRISRCISTGGSDYLANMLSANFTQRTEKDQIRWIQQRTQSIGLLTQDEDFLSSFKAIGANEKINTQAIKEVFEKAQKIDISSIYGQKWFSGAVHTSLVGFYLSMILSIFGICPYSVSITWGGLHLFLAVLATSKFMKHIANALSHIKYQLKGYIEVIQLVKQTEFSASDELSNLKERLLASSDAFQKLANLSQKIDNRSNEFGIILFNIFLLIDFSILFNFLKVRQLLKDNTEEWLKALSTYDAIVSMATFALSEDKGIKAEIVESNQLVFEAQGLYHPFLRDKAVANDFTLQNLHYYIITGANMAGKSTFLRTLGINYILAMNGLPVFAKSFKVSIFYLFTSMRTSDDLANGISFFNAELLRLKLLLASLSTTRPNLIILDEILKGTNSLDKLNGSRLFLEYTAQHNITGVIATHDLELSKMESNDRFHNYCFEIELTEPIVYSYTITKGMAKNQNATFLLNKILEGKTI